MMLMVYCRVKLKHFAKFTDMTEALSGESTAQIWQRKITSLCVLEDLSPTTQKASQFLLAEGRVVP